MGSRKVTLRGRAVGLSRVDLQKHCHCRDVYAFADTVEEHRIYFLEIFAGSHCDDIKYQRATCSFNIDTRPEPGESHDPDEAQHHPDLDSWRSLGNNIYRAGGICWV